MGQRANWERLFELCDGDYMDLPDPEGFKAEPEEDWPDDLRVGWDTEEEGARRNVE